MNTQIARQISSRMRAKNFSVNTLEKEAGLKTHAVRNILRGKSKRPSAETMQAVADVLGCTVKDLLENQEVFQIEGSEELKSEAMSKTYERPDLLLETVKVVNAKLQKRGSQVTTKQVLTCIEEVYLSSLQANAAKVAEGFADWFIDLAMD